MTYWGRNNRADYNSITEPLQHQHISCMAFRDFILQWANNIGNKVMCVPLWLLVPYKLRGELRCLLHVYECIQTALLRQKHDFWYHGLGHFSPSTGWI